METSRHFTVLLFDQRYLWCITTRPKYHLWKMSVKTR
jgi:hypothetical protein